MRFRHLPRPIWLALSPNFTKTTSPGLAPVGFSSPQNGQGETPHLTCSLHSLQMYAILF